MDVHIKDNSDKVLAELNSAMLRALERCGQQAEGYATDLCPEDTGRLRNSITHKVLPDDKAVIIGTNVEHAPYVELGTGRHYEGGRKDPWSYKDEEGKRHATSGQPAQPFLRPALEDHRRTYKNILRDEMKDEI